MSALSRAASEGNLELVTDLLHAGANLDDGRPLVVAAGKGHADIVAALLRARANPNAVTPEGLTPLWAAVFSRNESVLKQLLDRGAEVDLPSGPGQLTPLMHAAALGFMDGVRLLLHRGADVNSRSPDGQTPLGLAISRDSAESVEIMLSHGANVEQMIKRAWTPLTLAMRRGSTRVAHCLLAHGADVRHSADGGWSPLAVASFQGNTRLVRELLARGADPNSRDARGRTPVMWAAWRGFPRCYQLLISHGADSSLTALNGTTPYAAEAQLPVRRNPRRLRTSPFLRVGLGIMWLLAKRTRQAGIPIGISVSPDTEEQKASTVVSEALKLLETHDRHTLVQIRRTLRRVVILGKLDSPAMLFPVMNWCLISWRRGRSTDDAALDTVVSLVHESTHARLYSLGFTYEAHERLRIERVCLKASLASIKRMPHAEQAVRKLETMLERLNPTMFIGAASPRRIPPEPILPKDDA